MKDYFILAWLGMLLSSVPGCLVNSQYEDSQDQTSLTLSIAIPPGVGIKREALSAQFNPWDNTGLFHLEQCPKYVRIGIELPGQDYEQSSATWPDPNKGIGSGEGPQGEVEVELQVPAGTDRRIRGLGFVVEEEGVRVYQESSAPLIDLTAGSKSDINLLMVPAKTGTIEVTARCETGNMEIWAPFQVALVDERAQTIFPYNLLESDSQGALKVKIPLIPLDRPYWVRVFLWNQSTGEIRFINWRGAQRSFVVENSTDIKPILIEVPCRDN